MKITLTNPRHISVGNNIIILKDFESASTNQIEEIIYKALLKSSIKCDEIKVEKHYRKLERFKEDE